jgi:hypothetical protein
MPSASGYWSCAGKAVPTKAWEAFPALLLLKDTELVVTHLVDRPAPGGTQKNAGPLRFSIATAMPSPAATLATGFFLTYPGHDVGPNSVRILRQAVLSDHLHAGRIVSSPCAAECLTNQWRSCERSSVRRPMPPLGTASHCQAPTGALPADGREVARLISALFNSGLKSG